ncbi:MAG: glycosyltransferase [Candidatus Ancaeobacter aquaticus]|nr:glycosyltransferase [Candidatus Ancaeobacter aquaticus]
MSKKINILYILPALRLGGTEKQLFLLLKYLDKTKFNPVVCCIKEEGCLSQWIKDLDIPIINLRIHSIYNPIALYSLTKIIKKYDIHIIHTFLFGFDLYANIAARIGKVKTIISSRRQIPVWKKLHHKIIQIIANRFSDVIVANSIAVRNYTLENEHASTKKVHVIYNGLETNNKATPGAPHKLKNTYGIQSDKIIIGMIANFGYFKGQQTFIDIAKTILSKRDDIHFLLAGDGPLKAKCMQQVQLLHITENVTFIDTTNNVAKLLAIINIFAFTSHTEGFPNAILEAMAAGIPVIAFRVGGIPEIIDHKSNGFLIDDNDEESFLDTLNYLIENKKVCEDIGSEARKKIVNTYSVESMVNNYTKLYLEKYSE